MNDETNAPEPGSNEPSSDAPLVSETVKASGSFTMPADYYSQPPTAAAEKPGCPRWVPLTCGGAGCLILVALFGVAFLIARGTGSPGLSLWFVDRLQVELRGMMTAEVSPTQREAFDAEFAKLKSGIEKGEIKFLQLGEWLETSRTVMNDRKVTPAEVDEMVNLLRKVTVGKSKAVHLRYLPA